MLSTTLTQVFIEQLIREKYTCAMRLYSVGSVDWCKKKLLEIRKMRIATNCYTCV